MPALLTYLAAKLRERWQEIRDAKDAGYSTETALVTALLVTLALVVVGIIAAKVAGKADSIDLG
ncbi:hypothetical protein [Polymorphospora rubra]|uniref:Uncharacterized protein n=1 Tax=Polymorphospora rubra TaxID=338584 RepID=A0A810MP19_9ACTN|nr:hypothetical protein [Polymorphospora rubra]BCJ62997.1 hypothetical protein Prubr_00180 [Polymorphospora rubra]